ncbi:hypothetical protein HHL22_10680 [Hymenobacter sp. RP-2-7]|uniref:Uncharacterized protein n=1 Tax=Hymenobacter polaris TaxID=2682546 RepID=A0A7Y0FMQ5_9BACT|nr:hypothetical protein [Hymenobacter polaris]NML65669.1 hypothetical protein [Hymenobacter polaris]
MLATIQFFGEVDLGHYCTFKVAVATPDIRCAISFFGYTDTFQVFGQQLLNFPTDTQATVTFGQGDDINSRLECLLLQAYYLDQAGHTALRIVMDNKATPPAEKRVAFSLAADVSSLMELGRNLLSWPIQAGIGCDIKWQPMVS